MTATIDKAKKVLIIEIPIAMNGDKVETHSSATGNTQIVATSGENHATGCLVNGKPLVIGACPSVLPPSRHESADVTLHEGPWVTMEIRGIPADLAAQIINLVAAVNKKPS